MPFYINIELSHFCIAFGVMLLVGFVMSLQSANLYSLHVVVRKFSMIDLEFPASSQELISFIKGIFLLPGDLSKKSLKALKSQLYLDFIYMPALYGSIFMFCMKVSQKMTSFGHPLFAILAWLQCIAWLCDIIENIYLLNKLRPQAGESKTIPYPAYLGLEITKWGIALTATVCSIAAMSYFWLVGRYSLQSIDYILIIAAEIIVIFIARKLTTKTEKENLENFNRPDTLKNSDFIN
ncbi:MAG: hypothetical protein ABI416_06420 [Ginsengibacter sp.]